MAAKSKVVIVGAGGRLGAALAREYAERHEVTGLSRAQLDLGKPDDLRCIVGALDFDVLINAGAQTAVDRCETERVEAFAINAEAPGVLAEICHAKGARLVHIGTDYVFDGAARVPYREEDPANPISVYGESKLAGDHAVLAVSDRHIAARVSWVFGPDRPSFIDWVIGQAREKEQVSAVADKISTPTYTFDIARMLEPFFDHSLGGGLLHLANGGECSWQQYGQWALDCCAAEEMTLRARTVDPITLAEMKNFVARRPIYTVLATDKYERLTSDRPRPWRDAVAEYVRKHVV